MVNTKLILALAALSCLQLSMRVHSQEPTGPSGPPAEKPTLQLIDAETNVEMHEIQLMLSELELNEAQVEFERVKLHVEAAQEQGESRRVAYAELELKQAAIHVDMRRAHLEMARLKVRRAKVGLDYMRAAMTEEPGKPSRVRLEYVEDLDIVVIRGTKENVDRITSLIEGAEDAEDEKK